MLNKTSLMGLGTFLTLSLFPHISHAQPDNGLGQTIQIYTRFHSFVGKPIWTLVIRDIDHNQNIPYLYDITKGDNFWLAFTYGRNYLITASNLQIETYEGKYNIYKNYRIKNFCNLESNGRIIHGESLYITIEGNLSPRRHTYTCHISQFATSNFAIAPQNSSN